MLIVIEGVVLPDRRKFRPSDWAEMLIEGAGLAHFGPNHKIHYEDDVEPATIDGCASIIFDEALEQSHPEAYGIAALRHQEQPEYFHERRDHSASGRARVPRRTRTLRSASACEREMPYMKMVQAGTPWKNQILAENRKNDGC